METSDGLTAQHLSKITGEEEAINNINDTSITSFIFKKSTFVIHRIRAGIAQSL